MDGGRKRGGGGGLMALELVKLDSATLPGIADAIRAKTGDTALMLPSEMAAAIAGIPTGGSLPALTKPAAESDVLAGKEYIDGNGNKKTGTLVVADSIFVNEVYLEAIGVGAAVNVESSVDGSNKDLTLPEPNLMPENIKNGVMIYGCTGNAKILRVETGTITPAEDTTTLSIPCSANPKYAVLTTTAANKAEGDILGAIIYNIDYDGLFFGNCLISYYYSAKIRGTVTVAAFESGIRLPELSSTIYYRAGKEYQWTAYYWEDT